MKTLGLFLIGVCLSGCTGISHFVIGRQNLYFDGDRAHGDFFIQGDAKRYIKENGDPDFYKWDKMVKEFKTVWLLNLYYGGKVVVFKDNTYFGSRDIWEEEKMMARGYYPARIFIVDHSVTPYRYLELERK